jgi:hypothetical protein
VAEDLAQDAAIRGPSQIQGRKGIARNAQHVFHRIQQGSTASASGIEKRAVNVKKEESGHEGGEKDQPEPQVMRFLCDRSRTPSTTAEAS